MILIRIRIPISILISLSEVQLSEDPHTGTHPDPNQNVTDPEHCFFAACIEGKQLEIGKEPHRADEKESKREAGRCHMSTVDAFPSPPPPLGANRTEPPLVRPSLPIRMHT